MHQGTPRQIAQMLLDGEADIGIASEALASYPDLIALPCYQWTHTVIVPVAHPLATEADAGTPLTLARLARHPIITYETGYTGRSHINDAFAREQLSANTVLEAMDADVIKTYVELGMGVGIVAAIAYDERRDAHLRAIDARHLFAPNMTRLAIKRGAYLRAFVYDFIQIFAPPLTRDAVELAVVDGESPPQP